MVNDFDLFRGALVAMPLRLLGNGPVDLWHFSRLSSTFLWAGENNAPASSTASRCLLQ